MGFDKSFDRLHVYSHFECWGKEKVFENLLRAHGDGGCFFKWQSVDVYAFPTLASSGLFVLVREWWLSYECTRSLVVCTPLSVAYYSNLVIGQRAPELILCIVICYFCVCAHGLFILSELAGGRIGFSSFSAGVEVIATWGVLPPLPDGVQKFVWLVKSFSDHVRLHCQFSEGLSFQ